jgi:hypothetical protein
VRKSESWAKNRQTSKPSAAADIILDGDYSYTVLEEVSGADRKQLLRRERYHCLNSDCVNVYLPGTSMLLADYKARKGQPEFIGWDDL